MSIASTSFATMIDPDSFARLQRIGCTPGLLTESLPWLTAQGAEGPTDTAPPPRALMRVAEVQRESLTLHDGSGEQPARLLPVLRHELEALGSALAVGDWVVVERDPYGAWWALWRAPPTSQLARRLHDGRDKVERVVIVSNVDAAALVMGLDHDYNLRRLERYLALMRMADVEPVVVLTKADLCGADVAAARAAEARELARGAAVLAVDALADGGAAPRRELAPWLGPGRTLVLVGSSGAGKSTLTNALIGAAVQTIGANRADDSRGRHTTTTRSLHLAAAGGCIIDTPGLRTLRLDGDADRLSVAFDDIATLAAQCRFRDCRHEHEPGCAVRDAVAAERLRNWHKLRREAERDTMSALERKAQVSVWKARARGAKARMAAKRG